MSPQEASGYVIGGRERFWLVLRVLALVVTLPAHWEQPYCPAPLASLRLRGPVDSVSSGMTSECSGALLAGFAFLGGAVVSDSGSGPGHNPFQMNRENLHQRAAIEQGSP